MLDSKHPDEELILSLLDGDPRAHAIVESWRVRLTVTVMPADEFDALVRRRQIVYDGPRQEEEVKEREFSYFATPQYQ
jgi:hypothetical protein